MPLLKSRTTASPARSHDMWPSQATTTELRDICRAGINVTVVPIDSSPQGSRGRKDYTNIRRSSRSRRHTKPTHGDGITSDVHRAAKVAKGATRIRAPAHAIDPSDAPRPCHQRPAPRPRPRSIAQIGCRQRVQGPQGIETAADSPPPQLAPELYNLRRNLPACEGECRVGHEHRGTQQQ